MPIGWIADRLGRRTVLAAGTVVEAAGGAVTAFSSDKAVIMLGLILIGLGWCAANVSSTAIVIDSTPHLYRGAAIGMIDTIGAAAGVSFPLAVGPIVEAWGLGATGVLAVAVMVPAALLLFPRGRVHERLVPSEGSSAWTTK